MRHRIARTDALIVRRTDRGEADRLLVLCTPKGKRHVIAKGVRKTTSRLAGHIELFTHTTLLLAQGRNLDVVTQSQTVQNFATLRHDLHRLGCAYYAAELYESFTQDAEENMSLFSFMIETFEALNTTNQPDLVLRTFELQLLDTTGYRPHMYRCALCQEQLTEQANRFSPSSGGVLCPNHTHIDRQALPMSLDSFKVIRYLQRHGLEALAQKTIPAAVRREVEHLLRSYIYHVLEHSLNSVAFIESLRGSAESFVVPQEPTTAQPLKGSHHGIH